MVQERHTIVTAVLAGTVVASWTLLAGQLALRTCSVTCPRLIGVAAASVLAPDNERKPYC